MSKLESFLHVARLNKCTRLTLTNPSGKELHRGPLDDNVTPDVLTAIAQDDAADLPDNGADKPHVYALIASTETGSASTTHALRMRGGRRADDEHRVDSFGPMTNGQVVAHLVRCIVEQNKQLVALAIKKEDSRDAYIHELEQSRRKAMKLGEADVVLELARMNREDEREQRAGKQKLLGQALTIGKALAARIEPRLLTAGGDGDDPWGALLASLEPAQFKAILDALGVETGSRVLGARTGDALRAALAERPDKLEALMGAMKPDQLALLEALSKVPETNGAAGPAKPAGSEAPS